MTTSPDLDEDPGSRPGRRDARPIGRALAYVAVALIGILLVLFAYQAARTALALRQARNEVRDLKTQLAAGDLVRARATAHDLAVHSHTARSHSDNVLWHAVGAIPLVGRDVHAVSVLSTALDQTASGAMPRILSLVADVQDGQLRSSDGRFQLDAIARLQPRFEQLAHELRAPDRELDALEPHRLFLPALRSAVSEGQDKIGGAYSAARSGATAAELAPAMLGADGPRHYALVVQNNAEIRATGGLPGALFPLTADKGKLTLGPKRGTESFSVLPKPVLPLTAEETRLFSDKLGTDYRDANFTPDFPRAAQLFQAHYEKRFKSRLDGVIAADPVALRAILGSTGPVQVGSETITSENVLSKVLNEVYLRFPDPPDQDAYFGKVAAAVFGKFTSGGVDPRRLVSNLAQMAGQRRLLVWSDRSDEQRKIQPTSASGRLPQGENAAPQVGMYLNDATAGKMEYYLDYTGDLASRSCSRAGVQKVEALMTFHSKAPRDVSKLTPYVVGFGSGVPRGWMKVTLRIYAPTGGRVTGLSANGRPLDIASAMHDGRQTAVVSMAIRPQTYLQIRAYLSSGPHQTHDPVLQWTPGMRSQANQVVARSAC